MMQDYDFIMGVKPLSTNTSEKSVSIKSRPSKRVILNIRNYARCVQQINVGDVKITVGLN